RLGAGVALAVIDGNGHALFSGELLDMFDQRDLVFVLQAEGDIGKALAFQSALLRKGSRAETRAPDRQRCGTCSKAQKHPSGRRHCFVDIHGFSPPNWTTSPERQTRRTRA